MTRRKGTITDKVEELMARNEEAKRLLTELKSCGDVKCMIARAKATIELYKLIDGFIYQAAFVVSGPGGAELAKLFEDVVLAMSNELRELGIHVDTSKWAKALADTARYRSNKLDGARTGDVRKEMDNRYI